MKELSVYKKIALNVVKIGQKKFNKNMYKYNILDENIGREVKIRADKELNDILIEELNKKSSFNILSEENEDNTLLKGEYNWILDPLDGSYNYYRGIPIYCISLALWNGYEPVLGVIYDLTKNDIYHTIIGESAYKNKDQINVSEVKDYSEASISTGFPVNFTYSRSSVTKFIDNVQKYKKIRLFGSAGMSLTFLASGKIDAYFEENIMIWDVAAGISLVKGAGGQVRYRNGSIKNSLIVSASNNFLPIND